MERSEDNHEAPPAYIEQSVVERGNQPAVSELRLHYERLSKEKQSSLDRSPRSKRAKSVPSVLSAKAKGKQRAIAGPSDRRDSPAIRVHVRQGAKPSKRESSDEESGFDNRNSKQKRKELRTRTKH